MNKICLTLILFFMAISMTAVPSWAFGSRGHGGPGSQNGSFGSGYTPSGNDSGNGPNTFGNNPQGQNPQGQNPQGQNSSFSPSVQTGFPVAPVPEPMTLTLLGTGLAGIMLKKRKR